MLGSKSKSSSAGSAAGPGGCAALRSALGCGPVPGSVMCERSGVSSGVGSGVSGSTYVSTVGAVSVDRWGRFCRALRRFCRPFPPSTLAVCVDRPGVSVDVSGDRSGVSRGAISGTRNLMPRPGAVNTTRPSLPRPRASRISYPARARSVRARDIACLRSPVRSVSPSYHLPAWWSPPLIGIADHDKPPSPAGPWPRSRASSAIIRASTACPGSSRAGRRRGSSGTGRVPSRRLRCPAAVPAYNGVGGCLRPGRVWSSV